MALDLTKINQINQTAQKVLGTPAPAGGNITQPSQIISRPIQASPKPVSQYQIPEQLNLGQRIFNTLAIPSQKTEEFITGGKGYEQTLADIGLKTQMPVGLSSTILRMVLDPLNLLPVIKPFKLIGKIGKVTGLAEKMEPIATGIRKLISPVSKAASTLPEEYQFTKDIIPRNIAQKTREFIQSVAPTFSKLKTPEREAAAHLLESKLASRQGINIPEVIESVKPTFESVVRPFLKQARQLGREEIYSAVQKGELTGEKAKEMLKAKDYFHHTDFEDTANALQKGTQWVSNKFRIVKDYFKTRKGAKGYSLDAPLSVAKRHIKQLVDNEKADFLNVVKNNSQWAVKVGRGLKVPDGFKPFIEKTPEGLETLKGYAVREDIAKDLIGTFRPQNSLESFLKTFHKYWKPSVTAWNPSFHVQNLIGNLQNSIVGGIRNPGRIKQIIVGGFNPVEKQIIERSKILNLGQVEEALSEFAINDLSKVKKPNLLLRPIRWYLDNLSTMGRTIEDNARGAFFLDQREKLISKGLSAVNAEKEAFRLTNKFLFDYITGLTPTEQKIRNFFPFYTWARFNIPLQLEQIVKQPALYSLPGKIKKGIEPESGGKPSEQGFDFPTPFKDVRFQPNLPLQDVFTLNPLKRGLAMASPVKNIPSLTGTVGETLLGPSISKATGGIPTVGYEGLSYPITSPYLPKSIQAKDILNWVKTQVRPVRQIERIFDTSASALPYPANILQMVFGGLRKQDTLKDIKSKLNEARTAREQKTIRLRKAIREGNRGDIQTILRSFGQF